jgi:hypothetical protein
VVVVLLYWRDGAKGSRLCEFYTKFFLLLFVPYVICRLPMLWMNEVCVEVTGSCVHLFKCLIFNKHDKLKELY